MRRFDYIIVGAGLSGTALLLRLLGSSLKTKKILVIEKESESQRYDRMWSFWTKTDHVLSPAVACRWNAVSVAGDAHFSTHALRHYTIHLLHSADLFRYSRSIFSKRRSVTYETGEVRTVYSNFARAGVVLTNNNQYEADYVFDSSPLNIPPSSNPRGIFGWTWNVQAPPGTFDKHVVRLFDFRNTPERFSFYYVLPCTDRHAFVLLSQFGHQSDAPSDPRAYLESYLRTSFGCDSIKIQHESYGFIPLIPHAKPRDPQHRIMPIGAPAGLINTLTSYASGAILQDTEQIVRSLEKTGRPFYTSRPTGFGPINAAMIRLIQTNPSYVRRIFLDVFRLNPDTDRVLSFIAQEKPFMEYFPLVRSMNPLPLLKAMTGL